MKIQVGRKSLLDALVSVSKVIRKGTVVPVMDYVHLMTDEYKLHVTASDTQVTITETVEIIKNESEKAEEFLLPGDMMIELLKNVNQDTIIIETEKETVSILTDAGEYRTVTIDVQEYPNVNNLYSLENPTTLDIPIFKFVNAIEKVFPFAGNDPIREQINTVHMEISKDNFIAVATDAHKLSLCKYELPVSIENDISFNIPKNGAKIIIGASLTDEDALIKVDDYKIVIRSKNTRICVQLFDGKFPNYKAVLPESNPNEIIFDRKGMIKSMNRIIKLANSAQTIFDIKSLGDVVLSSDDNDKKNSVVENVSAEYMGEDVKIGFNAKFFVVAIGNIVTENVKMTIARPDRAVLLYEHNKQGDAYTLTNLIMPVLIQN